MTLGPMRTIKINNDEKLTLEIPDELNNYNQKYTFTATNTATEDVEIKLELKPVNTENIKESWYNIEPKIFSVKAGEKVSGVLTITAFPIQETSINTDEEEVDLIIIIIINSDKLRKRLETYKLTIPSAPPPKPVISLIEVEHRLSQLETSALQKQEISKIVKEMKDIVDDNFRKLESENQALKAQISELQKELQPIRQEREEEASRQRQIAEEEKRRRAEEEKKKRRLTDDLGRGVILELVKIPAGYFEMGGRKITLEAFLMGKYPITQAQWEAVMGNNPSHFKGKNLPVEQVSWNEAKEFCEKLSQRTGRKYQLPSEAQWEYACRADEPIFGDQGLDNYAWYSNNSNSQTHPVGKKEPNLWGLYDILGNVYEWCEDDWQEGHNHIPRDGSAYININATMKCLRGGVWGNIADFCRSDDRSRLGATDRSYGLGLRVVVLPEAL